MASAGRLTPNVIMQHLSMPLLAYLAQQVQPWHSVRQSKQHARRSPILMFEQSPMHTA